MTTTKETVAQSLWDWKGYVNRLTFYSDPFLESVAHLRLLQEDSVTSTCPLRARLALQTGQTLCAIKNLYPYEVRVQYKDERSVQLMLRELFDKLSELSQRYEGKVAFGVAVDSELVAVTIARPADLPPNF